MWRINPPFAFLFLNSPGRQDLPWRMIQLAQLQWQTSGLPRGKHTFLSFCLITAWPQSHHIPRQPREPRADSPVCKVPGSEKSFKVQLDNYKVLRIRTRPQGQKSMIHLFCWPESKWNEKRRFFQNVKKKKNPNCNQLDVTNNYWLYSWFF